MDNLRFEKPTMDVEEFISSLMVLDLVYAASLESHGKINEIYTYSTKNDESSIIVVFDKSISDRVVVVVDRKYLGLTEGFSDDVSYSGALSLVMSARQVIKDRD